MKKILLLITFYMFSIYCFAQGKRDYQWNTTTGIFLDFTNLQNTRPTLKINYTVNDQGKTQSVICDSITGKILFNSNGSKIYDSNMNVILNGDTLIDSVFYSQWGQFGNTGNQQDLLLPVGNKIFYFNVTASDANISTDKVMVKLYYHIIDPKANFGKGAVISKKNILINDTLGICGLQALRHSNGRDWWLYKTRAYTSDSIKLFRWLISDSGISAVHIIKLPPVLGNYNDEGVDEAGIQFNEQGTKMLVGRGFCFMMADVNRCSGAVTNIKRIDPKHSYQIWSPNGGDTVTAILESDSLYCTQVRGLSFSPNGKYIYVAKSNSIWQWEWQNPIDNLAWVNLRNGGDTVWANASYLSYAKLGPDNRIYIGCNGGEAWQVIDSPDVKGLGCKLQLRKVYLPYNTTPSGGLQVPPNTPNYKLGKDESVCWPLAIEPIAVKENGLVNLYPNPANSILYIDGLDPYNQASINIFDIYGKLVLNFKNKIPNTKVQIDVSKLVRGIYFVKVGSAIKKVVIE